MFDRFAASLGRYKPEYSSKYGCPLSLQLFQRTAIGTGELTEEHCPPAGLGKSVSVPASKLDKREPAAFPGDLLFTGVDMGNFDDDRNYSLAWYNTANHLRGSAAALCLVKEGVLLPTVETACTEYPYRNISHTVIWMLYGLSLEVIYKSIIVEEGGEPPFSHDLCTLADKAGLSYVQKEKELLSLYREAIEWDGKYPVPKTQAIYEKMCALETEVLFDAEPFGSSKLKILTPNQNWGWEAYDKLYDKAAVKLTQIASWITR